uniref:Uncharacterized protein n=1 Tax=Anguilla anguilla TaxID=7936 RepID=A0A0E9UQ42_ANGAN
MALNKLQRERGKGTFPSSLKSEGTRQLPGTKITDRIIHNFLCTVHSYFIHTIDKDEQTAI